MPVSLQDAAYAAGFFDGEGCITIIWEPNKITRRSYGTYHYQRYWLQINLSQNDPEPINWLVAKFGGCSRFVRGKRSYDRGYYERWDWRISTNEAIEFLKTIRPFLIVKAAQADVAFEFAETMRSHSGRTFGQKLPPDVQQRRSELFVKIKEIRNAVRLKTTG